MLETVAPRTLSQTSGVEWDLRRNEPHDCYSEIDFKIPGTNGIVLKDF